MKLWESYIKDVQSGKRNAGKLEKLTVDRFLSVCKKKQYYFDVEAVEEKLHIISQFRHTKGKFKGVRFNPLPWQIFYWAWIFGLKYREDDYRVVRESLLCMSKKGGKSEMAGATGVVMTYFDGQPSAECYSAANSTDQALYSWNAAKMIVKQLMKDEEEFAEAVKIYDSFNNRTIMDLDSDSFFKAISAETRTLDGVNPHFAVVDEYHEARDDSIPKNLKSGMVGLDQPLLMYVTTRGFIFQGELKKLENKHVGLLRNRFTDDSAMSMIFSFDSEDEEKIKKYWGKPVGKIDKSFWEKSNPGLGIAPTLKGLETMYTDAINEGLSAQVNVMVKNFNMWVRQSKTWLSIENWNKCRKDSVDLESLKGRKCYGAYDLSTKWDLTAKGLLFPPLTAGEDFKFVAKYYCPEDGIKFRSKRDKVPYVEWSNEGLLTATPGNVIDYDFIREDILEDCASFEVVNWQYDPFHATEVSTKLAANGAKVEAFKQTVVNYNEPIMKLEELILKHRLNKGPDPILDWMFENIAINKNRSGLVMFDKDKSQEKIDGMVVLAMCVGGYLDDLGAKDEPAEVGITFI